MESCDVRQEAGFRYNRIGHRVREIVEKTAPLVEPVTGLPLPSHLAIRLVRPTTWMLENEEYSERLLTAEAHELSPHGHQLNVARNLLRAQRRVNRTVWITIGGQTIEDSQGRPEVLLLPKTHRLSGRPDIYLHKLIAHELTHVAQCHASDGRIIALARTPFRDLHAQLAYEPLLEGHAYWADQEITNKLLGQKFGLSNTSKGAWRYRRAARYFGGKNGQSSTVETWVQFTQRAIEHCGVERFNRVWRHLDLAPTEEEIKDPDAWLRRTGFC